MEGIGRRNMEEIKVAVRLNKYDDKGKIIGRGKVEANLIRMNSKTCIIQLENKKFIKRKLRRDLVVGK